MPKLLGEAHAYTADCVKTEWSITTWVLLGTVITLVIILIITIFVCVRTKHRE